MNRPPVHELSAVNGHSLRFKYRATRDPRGNRSSACCPRTSRANGSASGFRLRQALKATSYTSLNVSARTAAQSGFDMGPLTGYQSADLDVDRFDVPDPL